MNVILSRDDPVENSEPRHTVARGDKFLRWSRSDPALTARPAESDSGPVRKLCPEFTSIHERREALFAYEDRGRI